MTEAYDHNNQMIPMKTRAEFIVLSNRRITEYEPCHINQAPNSDAVIKLRVRKKLLAALDGVVPTGYLPAVRLK